MPPLRKKTLKRKANKEVAEEQKEQGSDIETSSGDDDEFPDVSDEEIEENSGGEEEDDVDVKEITVEFEFFGPEEKDFLGLKALLSNFLNGELFDSSGMIDAVISEGDVGSVVKTDEDDDPIAIMTVLNTTKYKDAAWLKQLREFLAARCPKGQGLPQMLEQAIDAAGTGLILNERLLNSPPKLAPPLLKFLMDEIKARGDDKGNADRANFQYQRYLLVTRVWVDTAAGPSSSEAHPPSKKTKQEVGGAGGPASGVDSSALVFVRPEDEYLHARSAWHWVCPVEGRPVSKDGLHPHRLVMMVEAGEVAGARRELDQVVGNMASGQEAGAGPSMADVEAMGREAFAAAAAAGAGKGAGGGKKQKKKGKGKGGAFGAKVARL